MSLSFVPVSALLTFGSSELAQWLWSGILQRSLNTAAAFRNSAPRRRDSKKIGGPNGLSRNQAFFDPASWGGRDCLLEVDIDVVRALRDRIGDESILSFVSLEFSTRAEAALRELGVQEATETNGWYIFKTLLNMLYP